MKKRPLGKTGFSVSEIGFGGWGIGGDEFGNSYGPTDDTQSIAALHRALDLGVNLIDTSDIYGHGHSEALIGRVLKERSGPRPVVVTKGGINFYRPDSPIESDWTPYGIAHAVQRSLERLGTECLDVFLLMNPPVELLDRWKTWETLDALKKAGKIAHYGVSLADHADGVWLLRQNYPVSVLEVPYSLFFQGAAIELLPLARKRKVGILAREPLANGFLTEKYGPSPNFPHGDMRRDLPTGYSEAMHEVSERLNFLADDTGRTKAQAALRFVLDQQGISSVVVGIKTVEQVEENLKSVRVPEITTQEHEQIAAAFFDHE
jgi:aryl-alcohol dehydrogenase-like predicted oxidoreductase